MSFQADAIPWIYEAFGEGIALDKAERIHRFVEEALELAQALDTPKEYALELVDYVYGRPKGEPWQEVGGVMTTLAFVCNANGLEMDECARRELARAWTRIELIRKKQAEKPKHGPLPQ